MKMKILKWEIALSFPRLLRGIFNEGRSTWVILPHTEEEKRKVCWLYPPDVWQSGNPPAGEGQQVDVPSILAPPWWHVGSEFQKHFWPWTAPCWKHSGIAKPAFTQIDMLIERLFTLQWPRLTDSKVRHSLSTSDLFIYSWFFSLGI